MAGSTLVKLGLRLDFHGTVDPGVTCLIVSAYRPGALEPMAEPAGTRG